MPYYNVTPRMLYQSCLSSNADWSGRDDPIAKARAWVEAENVFEMWKLVQQWFDFIESGEAQNRYPDPFWKDEDYPDKRPLTQEVADAFIEEMDADFMLEKNRFQGRLAPEFIRLPSYARIAFVQDAYRIIKTSGQINEETDKRLATGEKLPPPVE
ncbi:MAG: hypothetical protein L0177_06120 [Chloroflexi bacterium]|nr:hypothetical protein [Chloroflexota bacterium]